MGTSSFSFDFEDFNDDASFSRAVGRNHVNFTPDNKAMPLRTSRSVDPTPQRSITTWGYSDILQGAATLKPTGATYDVFNQSLSNDLVGILNKEGNIDDLLGGRQNFAPYDVVQRGQFGTNPNSAAIDGIVAGATGTPGAQSYTATAPQGDYRSTTEMRNIWGNKCATSAELTSYTFKAGNKPYTVRKETVPVWEFVDSVFQKYNYKIVQASGGFNCRAITGGSGLSLHSFGIACDFNASTNPYGPTLITDMPQQMVDEIQNLRTKSGLLVIRWGGTYGRNKDAMHYEVMITPQELAEGFSRY